jgi:sialate O-acetylesterase
MISLFALLLLAPQATDTPAALELSPLFGDHMVLQCDRTVAAWGEAPPAASVQVQLERPDRDLEITTVALAGPDGAWRAELPAQEPGGPWTMRVATEGSPPIELEDVWFGDVWICSGQSNMEWPLEQTRGAQEEIAAADRPLLRLFQVPRRTADAPRSDPQGSWTQCSPETVPSFTAVGYYFGHTLSTHLDRPIGLIQSAWGGTPAEAWTERSFLEGVEAFAPIFEREPRNEAHVPSVLYNGMIAPLAPLQVKGAIWYQGESNAGRAEQYRTLFPAMIRSWRQAFLREDLPFLFVQLANFREHKAEPGESDWAELREAQDMALELARTGMAVIIDVGEANDIHPRDKRTVGERLALEARRVAYGERVDSRGPTFADFAVDGREVTVAFDHAGGLTTTDGEAPVGFALAGPDRVFHWAEARIDGERVVLSSEAVATPVAVRFAWADNPAHNLVDAAGLPAAPFRTDTWPGVTTGRR